MLEDEANAQDANPEPQHYRAPEQALGLPTTIGGKIINTLLT